MIGLNSYRFSGFQSSNTRNNINFKGTKEDIDKVVKHATNPKSSGLDIHDEIEDLRDIYLKKEPEKVKSALDQIIQYHENPKNPLHLYSEGIIKRCKSVLEDFKKLKK